LLQEKDVIVKINGIEVDAIDDISIIIDEIEVDNDVMLDVLRDGDVLTVTAKVGEKSDIADKLQISIDNGIMKMFIDGEEKKILDVEKMLENIDEKLLKNESKLKIKMDSLQDKLKDLKVDVLRIEDSGAI